MRCLRCALDFGPDELYCDRCGRALSRPLGAESPRNAAESPVALDTSSLYSTFAPPTFAAAAFAGVSSQQNGAYGDGGHGLALPVSRQQGAQGNMPAASPAAAPRILGLAETEAEMTKQQDQVPGLTDRPELALPPAKGAAAPLMAEPVPVTLPPDQLFGDDDDGGQRSRREKPAMIGADVQPVKPVKPSKLARQARPALGGITSSAALPRARRRLLAVALLVVLVVLAVAVQRYYSAYSSELSLAQSLDAQHQYAAALTHYQRAADDWPFNSSAKDGETRLSGVVSALNAQASATALADQAVSTAAATRSLVLSNWDALQRQAASQIDAASGAK